MPLLLQGRSFFGRAFGNFIFAPAVSPPCVFAYLSLFCSVSRSPGQLARGSVIPTLTSKINTLGWGTGCRLFLNPGGDDRYLDRTAWSAGHYVQSG
jgi:hypothetical protein